MSQIVVALPRLIELRSLVNGNILQCGKEEGELKDFVQFGAGDVASAGAKFEVHSSEKGNGLVHIRSCYNNKYLVMNNNDMWIVAKAEKPEEDQSKRSCTLFRPTSVNGDSKQIRLTNVYYENYLRLWQSLPYYNCVFAGYSEPDASSSDMFQVIDWQSLVLLPKYVAFKGDNDKFLGAHWQDSHQYLQFNGTDMQTDPLSVGNEIVHTTIGKIRIRNLQWDKIWRLSPSWIWADSNNHNISDTLFEPVKVSDDSIALRNAKNNLFCTRLNADGKESCLNANSSSINAWAKFKVSELIISRKIENIKFRLMDARIYDQSFVTMVSSSHINQGSTTQEQTVVLSYTHTTSSTWSCDLSIKASIESSIKVGIPFIGAEGELKLGLEVAATYTWGETKEVQENVSTSPKVLIPPNTKVIVRITSNRGTCDVPFSYTQRDVLYTGQTVITEMDDGVYTGVNYFSFDTETKEESLEIKDPSHGAAPGFKKVAKVLPSGEMIPI